jgi:methylated-DNA-[protein]-cysteine S-methyltransferase
MGNQYYHHLASPLGDLLLVSNGEEITCLSYALPPPTDAQADKKPFLLAISELQAYFAGELKKFSVPIAMTGTKFQMQVWKAVAKVPYGKTASYAEVGVKIGKPEAARAVGNANGANEICIFVPCHRIIAANGGIGGYNSGLWRKKWLLHHETGEEFN